MNELIANLTPYIIITQAVGLIGMAMFFISYQQNTNRRILAFQILGITFFLFHFTMLGAYTAAAINIIGLVRNFVFFCRPRKWASHIAWLYIFCALTVLAGILTFDSFISILPTAAVIFGTVALFMINPKTTRRLSLICVAGWFSHNILVFSVAGMISDIFATSSIIIAMFKFDFRKKTEQAEQGK